MRKHSLLKAFTVIAVEIVLGTMAIVFCLSFLLIFSKDFLHIFDQTIISWIYSFRSDTLTALMKTITFFGGEIFLVCGNILLLFILWGRHKMSTFILCFLLVFGTVINLVLKGIFQRPRPSYLPLVHESTFSFPSGHAMNSFIFYGTLAYLLVRKTKSTVKRVLIVGSAGIVVLLIGISRVYLGAHYPSDVIAGYIAGALWFVLILIVEKTAVKFKLFT